MASTAREMMRQQAADDARRDWFEYLEQKAFESPEAEEARWAHTFRQQAAEALPVHYDDRPGIDRRHFAVDGDLIEQARRDVERPDFQVAP